MTREEAIARIELAATEMTGTLADTTEQSAADVLQRYIDAYDMAISALREQPQWISVEDRLPGGWWVDPETGYGEPEEYIVFVKGATLPTFADYIDGKFTRLDAIYTQSEDVFADVVTHWMPLPEPPEVEV